MAPKLSSHITEREISPDERTPLVGETLPTDINSDPGDRDAGDERPRSQWAIISILSVLLVGVFVANVDMTFLMAIYPQISSEFNALTQGSWLLTAYMLSMCAVQPLYGKLSSIFGRKQMIMLSYILYASGSAICAVGRSMPHIITGRIVAGAGGAGMVCLVSIIITDIVPLREVAAYRSYVNIIQTVGRSVGAPIGGLVTDKFGWRTTFGGLVPLTLMSFALVAWKLESHHGLAEDQQLQKKSTWDRLRRVDFLGSLLIASTITLALLVFSLGGSQVRWSSPIIPFTAAAALLLACAFYFWETRCTEEPIFPPSLLAHRAVWTSYLLLLLQNTAQAAATLSVPLFFQITQNAQGAESGMYLLPSVLGNTIGGLGTGYSVKRTGRYKSVAVLSGAFGILGYSLMLIRWNTGPTFSPFWDDMYLVLAGFATGTAHSAAFMALTAGIAATPRDENESSANIAVAGSGIYLSGNVGGVVGFCLSSALLQGVLQSRLLTFLDPATAKKVMETVDYVQHLPLHDETRLKIVSAYVDGFHATFWQAVLCSAFTVVVALCIQEQRLLC